MMRSVPGLQHVEIIAYGYAIEYDFVDARELHHTLESKLWPGLYLAGQINGTTGYEEAAVQGFMACVNAVLKIRGAAPLILSRQTAYIGVLIDDLVTKGTMSLSHVYFARRTGLISVKIMLVFVYCHPERLGMRRLFYNNHAGKHLVETEIARLRNPGERGLESVTLSRPGVQYVEFYRRD